MVAKSSAARTGSSSDKTVTPVDSRIRSVAAATAPSSTVGAEESTSPACRSPTAKESKPKFSANTAVSITLFSRFGSRRQGPCRRVWQVEDNVE